MQNAAQQVADVLELTIGREVAVDVPWCPPIEGREIRRWIIDRPPALGGGIRRVVRLVAAASVCDRRGYVPVLYGQVTILRSEAFKRVFARAKDALAVRGIEAGETALLIGARGRGSVEPFEISYAQMPRLTALLDVLHNALGYGPVADMLAPVAAAPSAAHEDVARRLHAALSAWLTERLDTAHHLRQVQTIRRFLARRGELHPDRITDETIMALWEEGAAASGFDGAGAEGLRLYRSAVRAALMYRQALVDAWEEKQAAATLGEEVLGTIDADEAGLGTGGDAPLDATAALARLVVASAGEARWLTQSESLRLVDVLGHRQQEGDGDGEREAQARGGLAGERPVPAAFARTMLRAAVFAPVQARIIAAVRRRATAAEAVSREIDAVLSSAYADAAQALLDLDAHVGRALLLASARLIEAERPEGLIGLLHDAATELEAALLGNVRATPAATAPQGGAVDAAIRSARALLAAADAPPAVAALRQRIRSAERVLARAGFKPADRANPAALAALASGIEPAIALLRALPPINAALVRAAGEAGALEADRGRFAKALAVLHGNTDA